MALLMFNGGTSFCDERTGILRPAPPLARTPFRPRWTLANGHHRRRGTHEVVTLDGQLNTNR
jgi:hypothetical protein